MFCKNCGAEMNSNAAVCLKCGVNAGVGNSFCQNCGVSVAPNAAVCLNCGMAITNQSEGAVGGKSKLVAGLLALFLGGLGIHNFYLGHTKKAVAQLLISLLGSVILIGPAIVGIWALIDAIQIFTGKVKDSDGKALAD